MKIAVPLNNENHISGHFGQSDYFGIFTITDDRQIAGLQFVESPEGCGCRSDIASQLASDGVTVLLASGMGKGAFSKFTRSGISVIRGLSGSADNAVKEYLGGGLEDLGSSCHKHMTSAVHVAALQHHHHHHHHDHEHAHACGCSTDGGGCGCN